MLPWLEIWPSPRAVSWLEIETHRISKLELDFQLDHSWRIVATHTT